MNMLNNSPKSVKKGDTLIEVMFAVGIFGLAAVGAISLMNKGLAVSQNNLEVTMSRQEIDAQTEAIRFIHNAYLTEKEKLVEPSNPGDEATDSNNFRRLWKMLIENAYEPSTYDKNTEKYSGGVVEEDPDFFTRSVSAQSSCEGLFTTVPQKSFIINPRGLEKLSETDADGNIKVLTDAEIRDSVLTVRNQKPSAFAFTPVYPRLLYDSATTDPDCDSDNLSDACVKNDKKTSLNSAKATLSQAQGIWVTAIKSESGVLCKDDTEKRPDFYDFHVHTCWDSARGGASVSSSTVRLFNPDQIHLGHTSTITFTSGWTYYDNIASHPTSMYPDDALPHVIFEDNSDGTGTVTFHGYHVSAMDEGQYLDLDNETVVDIKLNAEGQFFVNHTNGTFHISIGPVSAAISSSGGDIQTAGTTISGGHLGPKFGLWINYDHGNYKIYASEAKDYKDLDESDLKSTYTDPSDNGNIRITLGFTHVSHGCGQRDEAVIQGILIQRPSMDITSCF